MLVASCRQPAGQAPAPDHQRDGQSAIPGDVQVSRFLRRRVRAVPAGARVSTHTYRVLEIVLPIGISFYTFQTIGYIVDVYRGKVPAARNLLDYALYVAFFPQLVAGPIERAAHLIPQFQNARSRTRWRSSRGCNSPSGGCSRRSSSPTTSHHTSMRCTTIRRRFGYGASDGDGVLRIPDLLRLLGLYGHGARRRAHARFRYLRNFTIRTSRGTRSSSGAAGTSAFRSGFKTICISRSRCGSCGKGGWASKYKAHIISMGLDRPLARRELDVRRLRLYWGVVIAGICSMDRTADAEPAVFHGASARWQHPCVRRGGVPHVRHRLHRLGVLPSSSFGDAWYVLTHRFLGRRGGCRPRRGDERTGSLGAGCGFGSAEWVYRSGRARASVGSWTIAGLVGRSALLAQSWSPTARPAGRPGRSSTSSSETACQRHLGRALERPRGPRVARLDRIDRVQIYGGGTKAKVPGAGHAGACSA